MTINPSFNIGSLTFHWYGIILAISFYVGWYLARNRAKAYKIPDLLFYDWILLVPLFLGIAGARIYHAVDYWGLYSGNLIEILAINRGGLGIWGGLIGFFIGILIVSKIKRLDFLALLDLSSPSLLLAQAVGRVGNFINQEGFGPPTNKPWGVFIESYNRPREFSISEYFHPTFFYEAILDLIFFGVLLYYANRSKRRGTVFALYLILYSTGRFIVEFWRIDTWKVEGIKVAHMLSSVFFIVGLLLFLKFQKVNKKLDIDP